MLLSHSGDDGDDTGCDNTNVVFIFSSATLYTTMQEVAKENLFHVYVS